MERSVTTRIRVGALAVFLVAGCTLWVSQRVASASESWTHTDLSGLSPVDADVLGANSTGGFVGEGYFPETRRRHAYIRYADGTVTRLEQNATAYGVNAGGLIVGMRFGRAVYWEPTTLTMTELPGLGGNSSATDVNDAGVIVGTAFDSATSRMHAVAWTVGGPLVDYGYGSIAGINNAGQIFGTRHVYGDSGSIESFSATIFVGSGAGVVYGVNGATAIGEDGTVLHALRNVVRPDGTAYTLSVTAANGVSYRDGVGYGVGPHGEVVGYVGGAVAYTTYPAVWDSTNRLTVLPTPLSDNGTRIDTGVARGLTIDGIAFGFRRGWSNGSSLGMTASIWTPPGGIGGGGGGEPPECVTNPDFDSDGIVRADEIGYGTNPCNADTDGDALSDPWELFGIDLVGGSPVTSTDGSPVLDLPNWGADPLRKDVYVEVDWMADDGPSYCVFNYCAVESHSHRPSSTGLQRVIDAFASAPVLNPDGSTGVSLHIDAGRDIDTGEAWTAARGAGGDVVTHVDLIAPTYDSSEGIRSLGLPRLGGEAVFHYALLAHDYSETEPASGNSFKIPNDVFVVTYGDAEPSDTAIARTFMHELGHNLGLGHGGDDAYGYKPNYLSIMNYSTAFVGLNRDGLDGVLDYARFVTRPLDQRNLVESVGVSLDPTAVQPFGTTSDLLARYRVRVNCNTNIPQLVAGLDYNCDGSISTGGYQRIVTERIPAPLDTPLDAQDDWAKLVFTGDGGSIGAVADAAPSEPSEPDVDPAPPAAAYQATLTAPSTVATPAGVALRLPFSITNSGTAASEIVVRADSVELGIYLLAPGASAVVNLDLGVIAIERTIELSAAPSENPLMGATAIVLAIPAGSIDIPPDIIVVGVREWLASLNLTSPDSAHQANAIRHLDRATEYLKADHTRLAEIAIANGAEQLSLIRPSACSGCSNAASVLRGA
ncbi:MAG TPA: hypothetical protein PK020_12115 [Ilumatobacteraceae bacterium]|nr:hypothetical protein [Ilumatobacteraceae bacterium]